MRKCFLLIVSLLVLTCSMHCQYLANPSFEGPPGIAVTPPDWSPFGDHSTPDTEPLCDEYLASHGNTHLTLVARGPAGTYPNTTECCQAQLIKSLVAGNCYDISIDLASRDDMGYYDPDAGFVFYTTGVYLKIFGSSSQSQKGTLLIETGTIINTDWVTFNYTFLVENSVQFLTLEAVLNVSNNGSGNLLIDNINIKESEIESTVVVNETFNASDIPITLPASPGSSYSWTPLSGLSCYDCQFPEVTNSLSQTYSCTFISSESGCPAEELFILDFKEEEEEIPITDLKIPNVFTPNGDGINDFFVIEGLPSFSSLRIFDRSGKEVYINEEYKNNWDGTGTDKNELVEDTYWYVLILPGFKGKEKGYVYLKRE